MKFDPGRREFLKTLARWTAGPALVGTVGTLASRSGETCINDTICRTCSVVQSCGLPQALSFRDVTAQERSDGR